MTTTAASIFEDDTDQNTDELEGCESTEPSEVETSEETPETKEQGTAMVVEACALDAQIDELQAKRTELLIAVCKTHGAGPWRIKGETIYIRNRNGAYSLHRRQRVQAVNVFE